MKVIIHSMEIPDIDYFQSSVSSSLIDLFVGTDERGKFAKENSSKPVTTEIDYDSKNTLLINFVADFPPEAFTIWNLKYV